LGRRAGQPFEEIQRWDPNPMYDNASWTCIWPNEMEKVLFATILGHDDFCVSPGGFDGVGTCISLKIHESDRMINSQMFIAYLSQTVVWLPTIGDDSCSRKDPVLDDRNQCGSVSKILTT
jgi:hypothetical protein